MKLYSDGQYVAEILEDSRSPNGVRLTTMKLVFPRPILAEFNTHRMFSRNSASSRAIPIAKQIAKVQAHPYIPIFTFNEKGMQGQVMPSDCREAVEARQDWLHARDLAVKQVQLLLMSNVHKQNANRLLEPFMWHTVIVTATEWQNFFQQRCSEYAQPEIAKIAGLMRKVYTEYEPKDLEYDQWHLPFISDDERDQYPAQQLCQISSARCARVSYLTHDGIRSVEEDITLGMRLVHQEHWSPFEHPATPMLNDVNDQETWSGNFRGWFQYRKQFAQENIPG